MAEVYEKFVDSHALTPINKAVVSPAIEIVVGGVTLGYIQNFTETQNRPASPQYEVGTVGIIENIPGQPNFTATANKLAVYKYNLVKIFSQKGISDDPRYDAIIAKIKGYNELWGFSALVHTPIPFDIDAIEIDPADDTPMITKYLDCYLTNYSRPVAATGNLTIVETCNIQYRDIAYA